jgi:hypothetical protein
MFLSSLGNLKNYGKYNLGIKPNPSNFVYSNINSKNKNNLSYHSELMLSNKYIKMLAERDEKSRIMRHLLVGSAGEPETKKPSFLSLVVVASLLGVSYFFYNRCVIIINS